MPKFAVTEGKQRMLETRMKELGVVEEDFTENFIRSSGRGGQHVNKASTCVQLIHKKTGLEVTCMRERSQSVNRFIARRDLMEKIAVSMGLPSKITDEIEKIRRSKARSKRRNRKQSGDES